MVKLIKEDISYEDRVKQYENYLIEHISNVQKAFEVCDKEKLSKLADLNEKELLDIKEQISHHDESKYNEEEWEPYLNWFYPANENDSKDEYGYDCAWIHHCHNNPHHFQYWVCINDDGTTKPIDMPINYIIEALCDWHSFSAKNSESTAANWWKEHRDTFNMTDYTKEWFDTLVVLFEEPLN